MAFTVRVEWAPAYEAYASAATYVDSRGSKAVRDSLDLGSDWVRGVRVAAGQEFDQAIDKLGRLPAFPLLPLLFACPEKDSPEAALAWLSALSDGEVFERIVEYVHPKDSKLLRRLPELRRQYEWVFSRWLKSYSGDRDEALLLLLRRDAAAKREMLSRVDPVAVVETATRGMRQEEREGLSEVILIPQFHYRPKNLYHSYPKTVFIMYPVEVPPADPTQPPEALLRLGRAIGDETRLKILKYLAGGIRSFSDITKTMDMSKATVHYHMMLLRAAGLIRTHVNGVGREYDRYSIQSETLSQLEEKLAAYILKS